MFQAFLDLSDGLRQRIGIFNPDRITKGIGKCQSLFKYKDKSPCQA